MPINHYNLFILQLLSVILMFIFLLTGCSQSKISNAETNSADYNPKYVHYAANNHQLSNKNTRNPFSSLVSILFSKRSANNQGLTRNGAKAYKIKGQSYKVMNSARGYKTRGMASWYGRKFHKKRTSSGDRYNMYAMTAAHKTLPLSTYVKVKNLSNGREIVVKVNDRGPFYKNRVIDLSYAAARKLGIVSKGVTMVDVEALPEKKNNSHPTPLVNSEHYYLQAGTYHSKTSARLVVNKIAKITKSPVVIEKYTKHYVVRVGPFKNKIIGNAIKNRLASSGLSQAFLFAT